MTERLKEVVKKAVERIVIAVDNKIAGDQGVQVKLTADQQRQMDDHFENKRPVYGQPHRD